MSNLKVASTSEFKIEKGVPHSGLPLKNSYPFGEMAVDDSFFIEVSQFARLTSAACWYGKRHSKKFSVRKEGDGYRCWRIA